MMYAQRLNLQDTTNIKSKNFLCNSLTVTSFKKSQALRKTKIDQVDTKFITHLLFNREQAPTTFVSNQISGLKSLTKYHYRLIEQYSKLKVSVSRLLIILFPEFQILIWPIYQKYSYAILLEFPSAYNISNYHLTKLTNLLSKTSNGGYEKDKAIALKTLVSKSIGILVVELILNFRK